MESSGQWLEKALGELCKSMKTGLQLEDEVISGLVSYCELASPIDAKEYLDNIIGEEVGRDVIVEYMQRRGFSAIRSSGPVAPTSKFQAYIKPPSGEGLVSGTKKPLRAQKQTGASSSQVNQVVSSETSGSKISQKGNQGGSKKKKPAKVVSLADAAKGSVVFQQGKPCSCQARRHRLVSNCLSCGKIICEQEGEGPCSFCGALVLREGTTYAGLEENSVPLSDAETQAEAYAKRLVEYDRNSAARTTVIDDQSDYYEIEGNSWLSVEEKELLRKKREEIEEAERVRRSKVVVSFDLFGRKVLENEDEVSEKQLGTRIVRPLEEREVNRIKPNPTLKIKPVFVDVGLTTKTEKRKQQNKSPNTGLCLEITGRVQHDRNESKNYRVDNQQEAASSGKPWQGPVAGSSNLYDDSECSLDYN